jgi:hypothetical protein
VTPIRSFETLVCRLFRGTFLCEPKAMPSSSATTLIICCAAISFRPMSIWSCWPWRTVGVVAVQQVVAGALHYHCTVSASGSQEARHPSVVKP